jgi:Mrp family chromosome partitioning ATPase
LTVLAWGRLLGGFRYIDELERSETPLALLGTIPELIDGDAERQALARLSVHHLRHMLEAGPEHSSVITITSACAGDGKTSLAYALGVSFATTGTETVVVDADLVGRGLTRQLGLDRVTGLREAARRPELNGEVHQTGTSGLWALPVGLDESLDPARLSPALVAPLLARLRERFPVVIVDSGPVLGSLEASVMCRLSDRVVLVVSRGQTPRSLKAAAQQVRRLGATCAGLVFNRAEPRDYERSTSVGSVRSRSSRAPGARLTIFDPAGRDGARAGTE